LLSAVIDIRKATLLGAALSALTLAAAPAQATEVEAATTATTTAPTTAALRTISFSAPVEGYAINSNYGWRRLGGGRGRMHEGIDIAAPSGTPILAAADGVVLRTGVSSSYGRFAEVRHDNGVTSFYAHMSQVMVSEGDVLAAGGQIGAVGSTGRSTGPHLHFEIRRDGEQINPSEFLGQAFEVASVAPEATGDVTWDAPAFFASAPVAFGPFRTLTPAFQP
jgi:murein DD-endopeptidase MepM/ murein hydrolase activator NlpD